MTAPYRTWELQLSFLAMDSKEVLDEKEAEVGSSDDISEMILFPPMLQERTSQDESNALEDAQKRLAELEKDNARWKELCFKMQQQIESQLVSKNDVAQSGESKHVVHHSQEDVGDAPDVVSNWQQQDAGKKMKNKRKRANG